METKIYGIIYKIENKINKKVYIGQTTRKNGFDERYSFRGEGVERVYNFHKAQKDYGAIYNKHLLSSIEKYGFESFDIIKIFDTATSKEELDQKEINWINHYKSSDKKYGYNKLIGGKGYIEGKSAYLSKLGKSRRPFMCLETKEVFLTFVDASKRLGICDNTIRNVCVGNFKQAYSKVHKKFLQFDYIETEVKIHKPVICVTTNQRFKSAKDASEQCKINLSCIIKNCENNVKSAGRHSLSNEKLAWKYQLDYELDYINNKLVAL